jgi:hypothetical protein
MLFSIYGLVFLLALLLVEPNVVQFIYLQLELLLLELRKLPLRIRLEWDIYHIKRDRNRYLKMANEILKELNKDEQV